MVQPLLYFKNTTQQGLRFELSPRVWYRGTFVSCCCMGSLTGLQFLTSGYFQKIVAGSSSEKLTYGQEVATGFLGGAASGPVCCVLELLMIQQQRFGGTVVGTPARLVRANGPSALVRGFVPSTGREAIYTAGYLGTVPATRKLMRDGYGLPEWLGDFIGACGAGLFCAFVSHPLDTVKTCMQGDVEQKRYKGMLQSLRQLHAEQGSVSAFYRGYWWRAGNIVFDFMVLNALAQFFAPLVFPGR